MACPSAIYTANTNVTVAENATVPFGTIVRRYGHNCQLDGAGFNLIGAGYYMVDVSVTETPTDAGPVTVQLYQDGIAVPGATATVTAAAGATVNPCVNPIVRNCGCDCNSTLTLTVSAAGVIDNISARVVRL